MSGLLAKWKRFFHGGGQKITVCIPAYNASDFVEETIESVLSQTYDEFLCIVSVDLSEDDTFDIVQPYRRDPRVRIFRQQKRLGWSGNVNFLFRISTSLYVCLVPHDDILDPRYLEMLLPEIERNDGTSVVFADLCTFGQGHDSTICQESIIGNVAQRVSNYLRFHYSAVLFRGIVNRKLVGRQIFCESNPFEDFSEDTIWGLRMVLKGDAVRIPKVLYRKRYLETSYHATWQRWSKEKKLQAWLYHCARCLEVVQNFPGIDIHDKRIKDALQSRILQRDAGLWHDDVLRESLSKYSFSQEEYPQKYSNGQGGHSNRCRHPRMFGGTRIGQEKLCGQFTGQGTRPIYACKS